ncbi:ATP-binding protein [Paenibacillus thalictri]|uniref:histidine kinase n=1 Tax=Paenibacillus thalictri TaxID=2527873 RepID=A0A4Q9DX01_9BACL|nr:ATP-binding protein [Paenibacillus thalictri]TBL81634.1 response regulator [Paenibacillus thalictri]
MLKTVSFDAAGRKLLIIAALVATLAAIYFVVFESKHKMMSIQNGVLDLSSRNVQDGLRTLDGEWEFYWNRFLYEADFQHGGIVQPDVIAHVPEDWNAYRVNESSLGESGFATYKLSVKAGIPGQRLSLKLMPLSTAYKVYINDRLLVSAGTLATEPGRFSAGMKPLTADFVTPAEQFDIIVHVSNFGYAKGGMNHSIFLGTPEQITELNTELSYKDAFILGSLAIAAFYSLSMFFMNREQKISLYFACVCLVFIGRIIMTGSYFIYVCFPGVSLNILTYMNYVTSHGGVLVFALMIRELFPEQFSTRIRRYFIIMTAVILTVISLTPAHVYSRLFIFSDMLCLIVLGYAYYATAKAVIRGQPFSILAFIANDLCLLLVMVDFYYAAVSDSSRSGEFSTLGFFAFIFLYAFILARRFSMSFKEVQVLSRRLIEFDKLKDEFLANTSHELKTPLHGIISIAESLLDGVEGELSQGQTKNVNLIASSGRKLTHLIHDILDMSKLKHGDIALNKQSIHIEPLAESVLYVFKHMYPNKPIQWSLEIPSDLPAVHADENRLVQIFYNLISNAVKFTDHGEVKVTAEEKEGLIEIRVMDTGKGILPDKLGVIFQAFEQADSSITREYGGVGLGLSITKHLVELHGGQIEVVSAPGQGSCFTVTLPAGERNAVETAELPSYGMQLADRQQHIEADGKTFSVIQSGEHILVVDDDYANLQAALNLLKLDGYTVTAVAGGRQALEELRRNPGIRLVILDVMMPALSGYEVCRIIRETKSFFELPVLMVTAKHQPEDLVIGFQAGANDFLIKPFEPMEFRARVKTLIELRKSVQKTLQSEVAFLQAQIKPHFLFNTLNTISYFCTRDGAKAAQLLDHFSDYLRSSFDFKNLETQISLARELEFINTYIEIEKMRFGGRLQTIFDVDEEVAAVKIPPLILQPLVENAIHHGTMKKAAGGLVQISVKRTGQEIEFSVADTGIGIAADKLGGLLSDKGEQGRVGLRNIHLRLQNLYGIGIGISSKEGHGTEVRFRIPASEGGGS